MNLPIMERKWNKINCDRVMKYEKSNIVYNLLLNQLTINQIKKIGFSSSLIYSVKKLHNL